MQAEETTRTARSITGIPAAKRSPRKAQLVLSLMMTTAIVTIGVAYPVSADAQTTATGQASRTSLDIPAQPLSRALVQFSNATGAQLFFDANLVRGRNSPAVRGSLTRSEALGQLLAGSGLIYRVSGNTVTITSSAGANAGVGVDDGSLVLDTITVQGQGENAWGPVDGYIARQSATGTKTDTPLITTPQSISVIGRQQIEHQGANTLTEILRYAAGVKADQGSVTNGGDSSKMRGFNTDQYLDGIQNTDGWVEPYLLERVEVARGPSSILYGQSSPAGLIGAVSKRPTERPLREVIWGMNEHGGMQAGFDFSGPIDAEGKFLYRLTAIGKSLSTEFRRDVKYERIAIAPTLTWRPTEDTNLTVFGKYQYDPSFPSLPSYFAEGTVRPLIDGTYVPLGFYMSDPSFDDSWKRQTSIGYSFQHRFNDTWTFRQNLRYAYIEAQQKYLTSDWLTGTVYSRFGSKNRGNTRAFGVDNNLEARFNTGGIEHISLFGLDYRRIANDGRSGTRWSGYPDLDIHNPIYGFPNLPDVDFTSRTEQTNWQLGLYAQDQIKWGRWNLTLGGRYDWARANSTVTDLGNGNRTRTSLDDGAFTGRVGIVYLFDNGIAPYASYSESFQPQSGSEAPQRGGKPFEPTTGQQFEIGIKYQPVGWDSFIMLSAYHLVQQNVLTGDPEWSGYSVQQGERRSRGIELSGTAQIDNSFKFVGSFSYLDAEITKDNPNSAGISQVGKVPYATPSYLASLWADYTFVSGPLQGLGLGAGVRYTGTQWGDSNNTFKTPSGTIVDAAIRYDFGKANTTMEGLTLSVTAQNLFDKRHVISCYATIICDYAPGRTVAANLSYKW